ncbi:MAG TPA: serine/threonine-protein kinase [Vicinamibacterales bacterium]
MKVLSHQPGDGGPDETRLGADETRLAGTPDARQEAEATPARSDTPRSSPTTATSLTTSGIDHGRFPPGTVLGERYRIVGKLGKGGMGEVFRADDLKLGQQVALKFLPPDVDRDPVRLTQLHTEVRMARQVSHPNVCRVYDIDEVEGHTFLSMEYVDGEDLGSLLRRIGRFNEERGLEIARQVCAGLAAAHERGVIHRDFKPANVMVDGAGHVRITDFGLAGASGETIRAGTPAYMAPEQLAGSEVTARSDIYALGLVLYEIFTGKRALEGSNLAELIRRREQAEIVPPSSLARELSPEIDRAVMRCLAPAPESRPASALSVSASLPGGDPLAAALAAGETPSPEMVAAAGEPGTLGRTPGLLLVAFVWVGLLGCTVLAQRALLVNRMAPPKSVEVLSERARELLAAVGHTTSPADTARGFAVNTEYLRWLNRTRPAETRWLTLGDGNGPILDFWYRTSPQPLEPLSTSWSPTLFDPPLDTFGMTRVTLDDQGRLLEYAWVPPQFDQELEDGAVDWAPLFGAAGLDMAQFTEVTPQWTPLVFAERRQAWEGPSGSLPDIQVRVEGASYGARAAAFKVIGPWTEPSRMGGSTTTPSQRALTLVGTVLVIVLLSGAGLLVRANLRTGRADLRGANRVALFLLTIWTLGWVLGARHSFQLTREVNGFFSAFSLALLNVGFTWLFYLALEPFVRRLSPDLLIGWARVLGGQFRDPRVGRDVLIGLATGVLFVGLTSATDLLALFTGTTETLYPRTTSLTHLLGIRFPISNVLRVVPNTLQTAMLVAFLYVLVLAIVRRQWLTWTIMVATFAGVIFAESGASGNLWAPVVFGAALGTVVLVAFVRFGLLTLATTFFVNQAVHSVSITLDLSQPHAAASTLVLALIGGAALAALYTSRAADGLFKRLLAQP